MFKTQMFLAEDRQLTKSPIRVPQPMCVYQHWAFLVFYPPYVSRTLCLEHEPSLCVSSQGGSPLRCPEAPIQRPFLVGVISEVRREVVYIFLGPPSAPSPIRVFLSEAWSVSEASSLSTGGSAGNRLAQTLPPL